MLNASFPNINSPRHLMDHFKGLVSKCISLCNAVGSSNPLFVLLLYRRTILESMIDGDACLNVWRQHADLIAVVMFVGMHNDTENKVTLCSEFRRRAYAKIFKSDKVVKLKPNW